MNKYQIIAIIFAVLVAYMFLCLALNNKKLESTAETEGNEVEEMIEMNNPISEEAVEALQNADHITVEKVERVIRETAEGQYLTNYDTYLVAEFGVGGEAPIVCNYALAIAEEEFDDSKVGTMSFCDAFGFEYQKENAWDLYKKLLESIGIDGDIQNATFDVKRYETSGRELYILNEHCSVLDWLLSEEYDEVLEQSICYEMTTLKSDVDVPDNFLVTVKFRSGNEVVTKTLYLQVSVNEWEVDVDE